MILKPGVTGSTLMFLALMYSGFMQAAPVNSGNVEAELISASDGIAPGETLWVALRQKIRPGWHTYWRNPGDSGAPTRLVWELPKGFVASDIHWPAPERIPYGPLLNFGYHGEVVFPVKITVPAEIHTDSLTLSARGHWLVCADICIPESASLELQLPVVANPEASSSAGLIADARQRIPMDIGITAGYRESEAGLKLSVMMADLDQSRIKSIVFFPFEEGVLDFPAPQKLELIDGGFQLELRKGFAFESGKSALDGIIVVEEDAGALLKTAFEVHPSVMRTGQSGIDIWRALLFAFLGGLILNLMPCVFPVLSIKILSLVQSTHADAGTLRIHGLVYVVGVVVSFLFIAILLMTLRAAGEQIGWGFQLQSPVVVGLLVYLFVIIGLNLSGYFEFGLGLMGIGDRFAGSQGYGGSFATGMLATVVAAPCTAPFMGAAIGYALTEGNITAILTFVSLGLGMAAPYMLLCLSPGLLSRLPKPGRWMEVLREFFAFPMFATAIWLIWVLNQQTGSEGLLLILVGLLLLGIAMWLLRQGAQAWRFWLNRLIVIVLTITALGLTAVVSSTPASDTPPVQDGGPGAQPYSISALKEAVSSGPVFVNFTAAWCITCKVNDLSALASERVKQVFDQHGVTYLKGDWTNEDPDITRALAEYGRSGVPLYLVYQQGANEAVVLPQILTESVVIEAIEQAISATR